MKPLKIFKIIFCAFLVCLLLSGCNGRENLKDLSVVEGLGIDFENGETAVTVQTLNLFKEGSGAEALSGNITMVSGGSGVNISSAVDNVSESLSKKLFFGQNRIIVFGMDYAENYLFESLDYLLRSSDSRPDVIMCISAEKAKNVIESKENNVLVPAQAVSELLEAGERSGTAAYITANELLNFYTDKTSDIFLPVVKASENEASASGIAVFDGDKLVRILKNDECIGFMFLSDKIEEGLLTFEDEAFGGISADIIKSKTKTKALFENGKVVYYAEIKADITLDEVENGLEESLSNEQAHAIAQLAQEKIKKQCQDAFSACTQSKSDCLRIGESLAKNDAVAYKKVSESWKDYLSDCELKINVICNIKKVTDNSSGK